MKMNLITGKLMETKLKYGWTAEDFAKYLDCTEEEFLEALKKVFSSKASKSMINRLNDNERQRNKGKGNTFGTKSAKSKKHLTNEKTEKNEKAVEQVLTQNIPDTSKTVEVESEEKENVQSVPTVTIKEILNELIAKEEQIMKEICDAEAFKVQLISKKRNLKTQLLREKQVMLELRAKVKNVQKNVEEILSQVDNLNQEVIDTNQKLEDNKALFENLQKEIQDLNKITILAYENGEIETEGPVQFFAPEEWKEMFQQIAVDEVAEELTVKQIKQVSKVIAFTRRQENEVEVIFDNEALQKIFKRKLIVNC